MEVTIANMVERWSGLERPLFKGKLIDEEGCKCAQGDVLSCAGWDDARIRAIARQQSKADLEVAKLLGISRTHSVLLRQVNDRVGGAPQLVLSNPAAILGDKAPLLIAFWLHLDTLSDAARHAAWHAAGDAAWDAARAAAGAARASARAAAGDAWAAAGDAAWAAAWADVEAARAAAAASEEIQGMDNLEDAGRAPYFLALFGFDTWDKVRALYAALV